MPPTTVHQTDRSVTHNKLILYFLLRHAQLFLSLLQYIPTTNSLMYWSVRQAVVIIWKTMPAGGVGGHRRVHALHCQPRPSFCVLFCLIALRCILYPTPPICPLVLLLRRLVLACHLASVANVFTIVAPMPTSVLHWHLCRQCTGIFANCHCPHYHCPLPPSNATINCCHYPPPPQSNAISLLPLPCGSPLPPPNTATLPLPLNAPTTQCCHCQQHTCHC
jgi:hypothetical protein